MGGNMKLNYCDISARESAASLDLSFHLCINLLPVSASCYKASYFQRCSLVSSVFSYSFWRRYLNGSGLTVTIHSCLHICQSVLSSIFYLFPYIKKLLILCYSCAPFHSLQMQCRNAFISWILLPVCPPPPSQLSSSISLCFTHLSSTWQNGYLSGDPSSNTFPTWTVHFILSLSSRESFATRLFFLYHKSFILLFFIPFHNI